MYAEFLKDLIKLLSTKYRDFNEGRLNSENKLQLK